MTAVAERLWQLIPGVYRGRDYVLPGWPMKRFVEALASELDELRLAIRALADDHFVERASADGVALLAELFGARLIHRDLGTNRGVVARSVAWRRRRGTQPTLEEVLRITTGWSAEVDESFRSLLHTQDLRRLVPWRGRTAILWDPIAIADPLSRNAPAIALPPRGAEIPTPAVARRDGEPLDEALRRTGRADAGRHAASPRTLDLTGWARPDVAVIRTARFVAFELEEIEVAVEVIVPTPDPERTLRGLHLDPLGRDVPLVWLEPLERPDTIPTLTGIHEPAPEPGPAPRDAATLLTPTALAEEGDLAEAGGAIDIAIDGVQLVGPPRVAARRGTLAVAPLGPMPVLRFADTFRPGPGEEWLIKLVAARPAGDTVLAASRATRGATSEITVGAGARTEQAGATVAVRIRRVAGAGARRAADGTWDASGDGTRLGPPLGPLVAAASGADTAILRAELHEAAGALRIARRVLAEPGWTPVTLTGDVPAPEPGAILVGDANELLLVIPERDGDGEPDAMGLYRVVVDEDTAAVTRVVTGDAARPPFRRDGAAAILDGRLYLHGGAIGGAPLDDLWSIAIDGSEAGWRPHPVRDPQPRRGGHLIGVDGALWLLGGESAAGRLAASVVSVDPSAARPRWIEGPPLPIAADAPGILCARRAAGGFHVVAWADSTRPTSHTLAPGAERWVVGEPERDGPNPPAPGECVFAGDELVVAGPPPLPMSEIILSMAGHSVLAQLPPLDLTVAPRDSGEELLDDESENPGVAESSYATYYVASDGSTWIKGAGDEPLHTRRGGALHASRAARIADRPRLGIPERLARHFFVVRQRSLGTWTEPYALRDEDTLGLDPRLGRVLVPRGVAAGRTTVSYRAGRGSAIGAGAMPVARTPREHWREPDAAPLTPPDLRDEDERRARVAAWVDPTRAGLALDSDGESIPIVGDLAAAAETARRAAAPHPVIGVLRSSTVDAARVGAGLGGGFSIVATDFGATPRVRASAVDGLSLALQPDRHDDIAADVWLAGLWLAGRLDVSVLPPDAPSTTVGAADPSDVRGAIDVRWCTIGHPGAVSIRIPGGGHERLLTRRTVPEAELELRLYGCVVGAIDVPPWVRVVAAGCTIDGAARDGLAIRAAGADVRLRHCTVHGEVEAGELRASSCVFAGAVRVDRRDRGWVRHSLVPDGGRPPRTYRSITVDAGLESTSPTSPLYLVLADTSGRASLAAGELGRLPGAHEDRARRLRELEERTSDYLPVGLAPYHIDRATLDLNRMARPNRRTS